MPFVAEIPQGQSGGPGPAAFMTILPVAGIAHTQTHTHGWTDGQSAGLRQHQTASSAP